MIHKVNMFGKNFGRALGKLIVKHPVKSLFGLAFALMCVGTLFTVSFRVWSNNGKLQFELQKKEFEMRDLKMTSPSPRHK
jgi:hypothetical protein